jgi:hypothetical protein
MQLTPHFSMDEVTFSSTALRLGIRNDLPVGLMTNVQLAANGMEAVRALLGQPVHVDSWYRCAELNHSIGGASQSAHMEGFAVDFVCPVFGTPLACCQAILDSSIKFDKCIQEGKWVHISFDSQYRRIQLTAHFDKDGKATYTEGIA